jgi:subtilisin family serine protease
MVAQPPIGGPPEPLGRLEPTPPGPPPTTVGTIPPPPFGPPAPPGPSPWPVVAAVVVGLWAVATTTLLQTGGWLVDQVLLIGGVDAPAWRWPLIAVFELAAVAVPTALLASVPRSPAIRAVGRAWFAAILGLAALTALRAVPIVQHELYLALLAVVGVIGAIVTGRANRGTRPAGAARLLAAAAGLLLLLPWLWLGALGGVLETVLAVVAAAAAGWFAAGILGPGFWQPLRHFGPGSLVAVGGLAAGVALALLGAGIGQAGPNLGVLLGLPAAAFALAALLPSSARLGHDTAMLGPLASHGVRPPVAILVALGVLGPLAFVDPEETSLVLLGRDAPFWALVAAASALAIGLVLAVAYGVVLRNKILHTWLAAAIAGVTLVAGAAVYAGLGQPGLHGERLFVILDGQADLSGLPTANGQAGRDARAREVYRRLVAHAEQSQADLRRELDRFNLDHTSYYLVNGVEVEGGPAVRALLSRRDDVDRILLSQRLRPLPAPPTVGHGGDPAPAGPQWNITMLGAERVWPQGVTGQGIVVGSSDSGIDGTHPSLRDGFRGGDDSWYDPWTGTSTPTDTGFHGTHTLASAVGRADVGVAPGAQWTGCVNLGRNMGNPAHYLDCLQFMLAPFPAGGNPFTDGDPARAPHVLTNSWGCPAIEGCDRRSLQPAVDAIDAAGLFFVAAAGNTGDLCGSVDDPPAPYADAYTVGAVDERRRVTAFSSRGPAPDGAVKPDIVAPGAAILSAVPGGGYARHDGTSMATPHVAGVVALMWSANPALIGDVERTRAILRDTAGALGTDGEGPDASARGETCGGDIANVTGAGIVDAFAAVQAARAAG